MRRFLGVLLLAAWFCPGFAHAQALGLPSGQPTKTGPQLLGANFTPVPEVLYAQCPTLPKGQGLLVEIVGKNSVAEKIGLHRHDVILSYGNSSVQDVKQLAGLLWATPPGQNNKFLILRGGKSVPIHYTLKVADLPPASLAKPTGPPAVNMEVAPLPNDRLKITFTYYAGDSSKLHSFICEGTVEEIETQLKTVNKKQQIPAPVQELLDVAIQRLRMMKVR